MLYLSALQIELIIPDFIVPGGKSGNRKRGRKIPIITEPEPMGT